MNDMNALPPNKEMCDKYYLGFYDGEKLIAVMDFIMAYPDELTAFIGFFMTDVSIPPRCPSRRWRLLVYSGRGWTPPAEPPPESTQLPPGSTTIGPWWAVQKVLRTGAGWMME